MPSLCEDVAQLLGTVKNPGDFSMSGRTDVLAPRIEVDGVGAIALPLLAVQARELISVAERAPYGRGPETIIDTGVRRTWQIAPAKVRLGGKHWPATLDRIVALAAEGLGVAQPVEAQFYKLLVYDEGSFFSGHRDTEKAPGMFATLVIALPSACTGGELVVRHKDRVVTLDLGGDEPSEIAFAAFYADCVHEVRPVRTGFRATLIFNLVRKGRSETLTPPDYSRQTAQAKQLLADWAGGSAGPEKIIFPLSHAYSSAELDFDKLKGADAAAAAVLKVAAAQAGCDLHLALLSIDESGAAEYSEAAMYSRRRRSADDSDMFEAGEVFDRWERLTEWRATDGAPAPFGALPIADGEVSPPGAIDALEPDEEHFLEATGNEGATFERTYRCAALVIWPAHRRLVVLSRAGLETTIPYLESLAAGAAKPDAARFAQAHELAGHMIAQWNESTWSARGESDLDDGDEPAARTDAADAKSCGIGRFLAALAKLGDKDRIEAAFVLLTQRSGHNKSDHDAILSAAALFAPDRAARLIEAVVSSHAAAALASCSALLVAAIARPLFAEPSRLAGAVQILLAALPRDTLTGRPGNAAPGAKAIVDLVAVIEAIAPGLATALAGQVLDSPATYGMDRVVVPAARRLAAMRQNGPAAKRLLAAALAHLEARSTQPLAAPQDWSRTSRIACTCEHCRALNRFLADPVAQTWTLNAAALVRRHVQDEIKTAGVDADCRTERKGSPHGLVCRKNRKSYEQRVAQRSKDLADLAHLKAFA